MAKYRVTIKSTIRLSHEVEADSSQDAEQLAETMYHEWKKGENTHVIGTEWHRNVELRSDVGPSQSHPIET